MLLLPLELVVVCEAEEAADTRGGGRSRCACMHAKADQTFSGRARWWRRRFREMCCGVGRGGWIISAAPKKL